MTKSNSSLIISIFLLLFSSCNSKPPDVNLFVYRALSISLIQSNYEIENQIKSLQNELVNDLSNPRSAEQAKIWQPKAHLIQTLSNELFSYMDDLKVNLKKEAGLKLVDMVEQWEEGDFKAVNKVFQTMGKGKELEQKIESFEIKVMGIDPSINSTFKKSLDRTILLFDKNQHDQKSFSETFFGNIPAIAAFAVIQKFENDIKNLEIQLVTYCHQQIPR